MKINETVLIIPPYISTTWKNIDALFMQQKDGASVLVVVLKNGSQVGIPHLEKEVLLQIFEAHTKYQEAPHPTKTSALNIGPGGIENMSTAMQHNPKQSDAPDLPTDMLNKITSISKALGVTDPEALPKPEPHCNCIHCQIARALQKKTPQEEEMCDEAVSDDELVFRSWDIAQTSEKMYLVTNPSNNEEQYSVFLGDPLGCTCGNKNCEHMRAVLNS